MYPLVDPQLGDFDHSSILFCVKMRFKIHNISFSCNMYLKSHVDWPRFGDDLLNHNWSVVYNSQIPVSELNKVITILIDRRDHIFVGEVYRAKTSCPVCL